MNAVIEAATRLNNKFDITTENDFWFLWEVLLNEGESGLYNCLVVSENHLLDGFSTTTTGGNASYIFGAVYVLAVFWILFGSITRSLQTETQCCRNGILLFM